MAPATVLFVFARRKAYYALGRWQTWPLEWFLALESLFCGAFLLMRVGVNQWEHMPTWALGLILFVHGCGAVWSVVVRKVDLCRRSALVSFALWLGVGAAIACTPPVDLFVLGLVLCPSFAGAWVYLRLAWVVEEGRWFP